MQINNSFFRPRTETDVKDVVFKFALPNEKTAAMGDMIAWLPAIIYVAEVYNYVAGHLVVPEYFFEVAKNVLNKYPHWRIYRDRIPDNLLNGVQLREQIQNPANATGFHLVDLGFVYFVGINPPPKAARLYPELDLEGHRLNFDMPEKYVVLTPVAEAKTRKLPAPTWNKIIEHLVEKKIVPVVLGKTSMERRELSLDPKINISQCLNLLDKTTLIDAALIMKKAIATVGVDNGLLHLAGMTDATIVYGYTIAGPSQRQIPRKFGHTIELYPDRETLPCSFCQENVRFFLGHSFTDCIYKLEVPDCVKVLNAESFCAAIDSVV